MPKLVVIHCAATPDDKDFSAADIHRWHQERGWDGIGYHWVIRKDGQLEAGRPEYWRGAHVEGHNSGSIGICLIGTNEFTWRQAKVLFDELLKDLEHRYGELDIKGHYELDSGKTCPNFNPREKLEQWRNNSTIFSLT